MMRSMFSGVSGLRVHQTKMDVIANNIANVNTTGFKSSRVTFSEVFSQTLQGAAGANEATGRGGINPMQIGLGVNVASIDMLMTPGAAQRTDGAYDLMIEGEGFFIVGDDSGTYFTRAGAFRLDEFGNLTNYQGLMVMGWEAVPGTGANAGKQVISRVEAKGINIGGTGSYINPEKTTAIAYEGNLNVAELLNNTKESSISFYDSLGTNYTMKVKHVYDTATKQWNVSLGNYMYPNDNETNGIPVKATFVAGADGKMSLKLETYTAATLPDKNGYQVLSTDTTGTAVDPPPLYIKFDKNGDLITDLASYNAYLASQGITTPVTALPPELMTSFGFTVDDNNAKLLNPDSAFNETGITVDFSKLTQHDSKTTAAATPLDGAKRGTLEGVSIGPDGKITGRYSNGKTKLLAQIAIAKFKNPAGLQKVGNNLFVETANSGSFNRIGEEADSILGGCLEMSNVDLSMEFTEMITTQRGFQANSRIISTSDDMLQELVNLKR